MNDMTISRILRIVIGLILLYWTFEGVAWVWSWYLDSGGYTSEWWSGIGKFLLRNISIIVVIYGVACMQVSGLAELKFGKNYLKAFGLALILSPPIMMAVYGKKSEDQTG
ncbi:MAG: hypothetical protein V3U16_07275 [Candidatus Neomarinimicrobiota bacterium]